MNKVIFIVLMVIGFTASAQSIKIFGKVTDPTTGPIPGATVMLIGQQDSILKSFAVTDKEGNFTINNVKPNDYLFKANFYGYQPYEKSFSITESSADTALSVISLQPKMLDMVTVSSDYIPIQIKGDTIEYDSRAFETDQHDVVENLLEQLPGVEVQADGSIKVQGKTVQKILVDGEEFFGSDPTIATKNLPADAVDKVQVFDKASDMATFTGIDDGDESTTINLKLKEDRKKGYFGNLEAAGGNSFNRTENGELDDYRYKLKGNIHYFKGKWQTSLIGLSNNVNETGFSIDDYISFMGGIQNLMSGGSGSLNFDSNDDSGLPLDFGQGNTGFLNTNATGLNLNYKPSKKASVSSSFFFNTFDKTFDRSIDRTTFFQDSSVFSTENILQNSTTLNSRGNIHYKQEFDSTHFLNADFSGNWTNSNYVNRNGISNFDRSNAIKNTYTTNLNQDQLNYRGQLALDYRKKFAKKGRYTGGGIALGLNNQMSIGQLAYESILYQPDPFIVTINQNQDVEQLNANLAANWMYSEPIFKKQLLQLKIGHERNNHSRNKRVTDEISPGEFANNPFFSGEAGYMNYTNQAELKHKYLSKKFRATVGASYRNVHLISDDLFNASQIFDYVLPFFDVQWEINKSSELSFDYNTRNNLPNIVQLQTLPDNTNPAEIVLGNSELIPEYQHDAAFEYNLFNEFNFTHFMMRIGAKHIENKINYSQEIDANLNRVFTPENNGTEQGINSYISFGTNLSPIKTKFSISNMTDLSRGQLKLNDVQNQYTSFYNNTRLTIENTKKKVINIRTGLETTYSKSVYSENENLDNDFFSWNYSANVTLKLKKKWVLNANAKHYFYPGFENNNEQLIVNASIARNLLESKKLQIYVAGFDLLNQNTGINQTYFLNYFEQERTATLARYFMLGVKYSFQKLGGK